MTSCAPSQVEGVLVASVRPRSAAARAGLRAGDRIVAINGAPLRDAIDFHYHAGEARLRLQIERDGRTRHSRIERARGHLGLELEAPRPGEIATCANKCVFCFIHQLPKGMRKSLYVKDDDFRLSFLHGNYITLTDLEDTELRRIEEQRLSPLYVSVHAMEPDLRHRLLGQPAVRGELMPRMERLARSCSCPNGMTARTSSARSATSRACILRWRPRPWCPSGSPAIASACRGCAR